MAWTAPQPESTPALQPDDSPTHNDIAVLAYRLWEEAGRRDGCAEQDWFRAERLLSESPSAGAGRATSIRAVSAS